MIDVFKLRISISDHPGLSSWVNPMTSVRIREKRRHTHRGGGHVKKEAEIGVVQPQGRECLQPAEAGRGKERFSLEPVKGTWFC